MNRLNTRITDITGVNQGGTAVASLDVGPRYFNLKFSIRVNGVLTAVADVVDRVRLKVNEKTIWDVSAARLLARDLTTSDLQGLGPAVGILPIDFAQASRADKTDEVFTAWDTFGERSFTVELTLKDLANPADIIRVTGFQSFDYGFWKGPKGERVKNIIRLQEVSENLIAGAVDVTKLPVRNPIQRIFFDTAANISLVEIDADGRRVHELPTVENAELLKPYGLDQSQFAYVYAADYSEQIMDHLAVSRTLNARVTADASQPVICLVESLSLGFDA